jgi:hypothetical protein
MSLRQGSGSESEGGKRTTLKLRMSGSPDGTPRGSRAGSPAGGMKRLASVGAGSRPGSPPASTPGASGKAQICENSPCYNFRSHLHDSCCCLPWHKCFSWLPISISIIYLLFLQPQTLLSHQPRIFSPQSRLRACTSPSSRRFSALVFPRAKLWILFAWSAESQTTMQLRRLCAEKRKRPRFDRTRSHGLPSVSRWLTFCLAWRCY